MITFPGRYYVWLLLYVVFCTIMAISRHKEARIRDYALYSYFEWLQGFFIAHSAIGSTVHSRPLNSVEHCICTTTMTNIRPDRDSNLVLPGNKPQSIRMSHQGQPSGSVNGSTSCKIFRSNINENYSMVSPGKEGLIVSAGFCDTRTVHWYCVSGYLDVPFLVGYPVLTA